MANTCMNECTQTRNTHVHTCTHTHTTYLDIHYTHARTHARTHAHTHARTHTHTCTHINKTLTHMQKAKAKLTATVTQLWLPSESAVGCLALLRPCVKNTSGEGTVTWRRPHG